MHVLIVTHYYPPLNAIASFRLAMQAKYFVEQGIHVTVLTTVKTPAEGSLDLDVYTHPNLNIIEIPYKPLQFWRKSVATGNVPETLMQPVTGANTRIKRILTQTRKWGVSYLGSLVDYQFFWTKKAIEAFFDIHENKPVDVVISSFSPPSAHFIANAIIKKHPSILWIADYRDLWSQRHIMTAKGIFNWIESYIEKRTIKHVSHITTVSQPLAQKLTDLVKGRVPVSVIYNGYDSEIDLDKFSTVSRIEQCINIVYTGTIYEGRSDPSPLFKAITQLESEGVLREGDIMVSFYGNRMANLNQIITNCNASKWVRLMGAVSHHDALLAQQNADFLLFLESNKPDARGVLTGKLFEYITTGKTILAVGVDEYCASSHVIMETKTGVVFGEDIILIKNYLKQVWINKQEPMRSPRLDKIVKYSRLEQSAKMLELVKALGDRSL